MKEHGVNVEACGLPSGSGVFYAYKYRLYQPVKFAKFTCYFSENRYMNQ